MQIVCALLIFLCLSGTAGLFLFQEYVRKAVALSISYGSFVFLIILLSLQSDKQSDLLLVVVTIFIIFSINLLTLIGLARDIENKNK